MTNYKPIILNSLQIITIEVILLGISSCWPQTVDPTSKLTQFRGRDVARTTVCIERQPVVDFILGPIVCL